MVALAAAGVATATAGATALALRSGPVSASVPSAAAGAHALLVSAPSRTTAATTGTPGTATGALTSPSAVPTPRTPHQERATSASRDLAPARGTTRASAASRTTSRTSPRATTSSAKPSNTPSSRSSSPKPSTTTTTKPPSGGSSSTYEAQLLSLVNAERTSRGLSALRAASCPDRFAESWASHLASTGTFSHQSLGPIMSSCGATRAAENIARGGISASAMVSMWMGSSGHRANILDPELTQVGTAAVRDSSGTWTAVQDFIRP